MTSLLGKVITKYRGKAGLSNQDLASKLDMDPSALSRIVTGNRTLPLRLYGALASAIGVNVGAIELAVTLSAPLQLDLGVVHKGTSEPQMAGIRARRRMARGFAAFAVGPAANDWVNADDDVVFGSIDDHGTLPETRTASPRDTPGTEHHFLLWFRHNVRLGPAEGDIIERMSRKYFDEFGSLPDGWDGCDECGEPPAACECTSNWRKDGR